jgi:retron-type reverse transcriptase
MGVSLRDMRTRSRYERVTDQRSRSVPGAVKLVEERIGVPGFLEDLRAQLKTGTFQPLPVRERKIPKPGGAVSLPIDTSVSSRR